MLPNIWFAVFVLAIGSGCSGEQLSNAAVCGNGVIQQDEECDNGPSNGDNAECTPDCIRNICGDGLVLNGVELCDAGTLNSDEIPDACRTDCVLAHCGDSVIDTGEDCDAGDENSDTDPDGCTTICAFPYCTPTEIPFSNHASDGAITGQRGESISVVCDPGYIGGGEWICGASGAFTGTHCSPSPCTAAEVPHSRAHSTPGSIAGLTGDSLEVICDSGHEGGGTWTCLSNGIFEGQVCIPIACTPSEAPHSTGHPTSGSITGSTGETVTVNCELGYSGGGTWTCTGNGTEPGTFTGQTCVANACTPTQTENTVVHSGVASIEGVTGDVVDVVCSSG